MSRPGDLGAPGGGTVSCPGNLGAHGAGGGSPSRVDSTDLPDGSSQAGSELSSVRPQEADRCLCASETCTCLPTRGSITQDMNPHRAGNPHGQHAHCCGDGGVGALPQLLVQGRVAKHCRDMDPPRHSHQRSRPTHFRRLTRLCPPCQRLPPGSHPGPADAARSALCLSHPLPEGHAKTRTERPREQHMHFQGTAGLAFLKGMGVETFMTPLLCSSRSRKRSPQPRACCPGRTPCPWCRPQATSCRQTPGNEPQERHLCGGDRV